MASASIRERILAHVATSLALINGAGAYTHALAPTAIARGKASADVLDAALPAAWIDVGDEDVLRVPNGKLSRTLPVAVEAWIKAPAAQLEELPTLAEAMLADLERALTADGTRGGLATSTVLTATRVLVDSPPGTLAQVLITVTVAFRTVIGSPEQAG